MGISDHDVRCYPLYHAVCLQQMAKGLRLTITEIAVNIANLPPTRGTDLCRQEVAVNFHTLDKVTSGYETGRTVNPSPAQLGLVDALQAPTVCCLI